jgi:phosphoribosylaminoimidazole-succinocarboxamide synthase
MIQGRVFLRRGKVKDIYRVGGGRLLFVYTNRLSSHDVMLADEVPHKGEVLCRLSTHCFQNCEREGIETHLIEVPSPNEMIVRELSIIPVEVIGRNYLYGTYWRRYEQGEVQLPPGTEPLLAARLTEPIIEYTTKFEAKDRPITRGEIVERGWCTREELTRIEGITSRINELIQRDARRAGFLLSDFKLEFGRETDGRIVLADEAETPDTSRFWEAEKYKPGEKQESFDKQVVRDYMENMMGWRSHQPKPGTRLREKMLPEEVIEDTSRRYIEAYERLTGGRFREGNKA